MDFKGFNFIEPVSKVLYINNIKAVLFEIALKLQGIPEIDFNLMKSKNQRNWNISQRKILKKPGFHSVYYICIFWNNSLYLSVANNIGNIKKKQNRTSCLLLFFCAIN